ncbi:MAG: hypothetical protein MUP21_05995 [Dehalococcoidia bacterium]|nr:hypothetical protein [Dehalococcoidia bacterium]
MAKASLEFDLSTDSGRYEHDSAHNAVYYQRAFADLLGYLHRQNLLKATLTPAMILAELEKFAEKHAKLEHLRMLVRRHAARPLTTN